MDKTKLCVGVVGAGAISEIYLQNMTMRFDSLTVKSICANHIESAQKRAEAYGITAVTMEEMLEDEEIDLIVNLTPTHAHYDVIKAALEHGKHVYTEKTLTDNLEKSAALISLAKDKGLYLGSAPDTFMGAALQTARAAIDDGLLGEINSFVISGNRNNDILLSMFAFLRQPGGGIVCDYGVYYVTALVSLLGPVERVGGIVRAPYPTHVNILPGNPLEGQVMDTPNESEVSAVLQMESGVTGTIHINADSIIMDQAYFLIYGTKGILVLTDPNQFGGTVKIIPQTQEFWKPAEPVMLWNFTPYSENTRGVGPDDLANAILSGSKCRPSMEMAYHVHEVLTAILAGGEKGRFVDIASTCERPAPLPQKRVPITRIAHTAFNVKNMDRMLHFYVDVLGMKKLFTLTFKELSGSLNEHKGERTPEWESFYEKMKNLGDRPWIVYLKLADGQFIELFYQTEGFGPDRTFIENRQENYGYLKMNFEVDDIQTIRDHLAGQGITIDEDIHTTVDGSREIVVHDPEGNEVQFTEYPGKGAGRIAMEENPAHGSCSMVNYITQTAYQVKDETNMLNYYTKGLGLKHVDRLTFGDLADLLEKGGASADMIKELRAKANKPWIDYIEVASHQYIELFYTGGQKKKELRDLSGHYGYQHLCLEVDDIHAAWDAVTANGLTPDTEISLGCDDTWQFWLTDPDGNRMEFHAYTEKSKQLTGVEG